MRIESNGNLTMRSGGSFTANRADNTRDTKVYTDNSAGYLVTSFDPLHVQSANRLVFFTNGANERMRVNINGNVGIGTTTDSYRLHVYHATNDAPLFVDSGSVNGAHMRFGQNGSVKHYIGCGGGISLGDDDQLSMRGFDKILFATGNSSTERMRIDSAGRVGIGTSSLVEKFQIGAAAGNGAGVEFAGNGTTVGTDSFFVGQGSGSEAYVWQRNSNDLIFGQANTERWRIVNGGDLKSNSYAYNSVDGLLLLGTSGRIFNGINFNGYGAEIYMINNRIANGVCSLMQYRTNGTVHGSIYASSSGLSFNNTSDYRVKSNVTEITGSLDKIASLRPVSYNLYDLEETNTGFIAHEVQEIFPEMVYGEKDAVDEDGEAIMQGLNMGVDMTAHLVAAIKELKARIEVLESA